MADSQPPSASGGQGRWGDESASRSRGDPLDAAATRSAPEETECLDWCPICRGADVLRATTSPEIRGQWNEVQREALVTLRAFIDHYIEYLDERPRRATPVEEIPVE